MRKLILCVLAFTTLLTAQSDRGRVSGTAFDSSGSVLANAQVTVRGSDSKSVRSVTTDTTGRYFVNELLPGDYDVTASIKGFGDSVVKGITVLVGQEKKIDLTLQAQTVQQQVTVESGQLAAVDTSSADLGATVSAREVNDLPVNGRMVSQLYLLIPGASMSGAGTFDDLRFFGRSNEQNVIRYDGIEAGTLIDSNPANVNGANTSQFRLSQSMENIQEFRVEASSYNAEFGRGTGGQVTIITKSGSNNFHGDIFEFFRNSFMDARNYFNAKPASQSPLRLNQFGGSVGGPIVKDKLFFFASQENLLQRVSANFREDTLSSYARSLAVPSIRPVLAAFPLSNVPTSDPNFSLASGASPSYVNEYFGNLRLDWRINDKNTAYFRYQRDQGDAFTPTDISGSGSALSSVPQNAIADLTTVFSPSIVNDFKAGFNGAKTNLVYQGAQVAGADLSNLSFNIGGGSGLYTGTGLVTPTGAGSNPLIHAQPYTNYEFEYIDNLSWSLHSHNIKMGVEINPRTMYANQIGGAIYTFTTVQNFLANNPSQVQLGGTLSDPSPFFNGATGVAKGLQNFYGAYLQDEWKIRQNLTLNYGLRYDYFSPLTEAHGREVNVNTNTGALELGQDPYSTSKLNFGPRLALAWSPLRSNGKTVLRLGGGYYYGPGQGEDQIQPLLNDTANQTLTTGNIGYPINIPAQLATFVPGSANANYQPRVFGAGYQLPEKVLSYTASVQQTLPDQSVLTVAYVGSQGRNLFLRTITNPIVSVGQAASGSAVINRAFGNQYAELDVKTSGGTNMYSGLQVSWNRRLARGLTAILNYTWSTNIGTSGGSNETITSQNNFNFTPDKAFNIYDMRHNLNLATLWDVPLGKGHRLDFGGNRFLNSVVGGWQLGGSYNFHSGLPINVTMTRQNVVYLDNQNGRYYQNPVVAGGTVLSTPVINIPGGGQSRGIQRPDLVPGVTPYVSTSSGFMLNPAAFAVPQPGTYGNLGRDALRGPQFSQLDLTLSKRFSVTERAYFELRGDAYNILNHANFANPPAVLGIGLPTSPSGSGLQPGGVFSSAAAGSSFGLLNSTVGNYVNMGTARQLQLAVRFVF